jgi:hypothetical protein
MQAIVATDALVSRWHIVCDNLNIHQSESLVRLSLPRSRASSRNWARKANTGSSP